MNINPTSLTLTLLCHFPVSRLPLRLILFLDYRPNEFLMDLVGRVQTHWDSAVRTLVTLLLLFLLWSPPSPLLLLSLSHPLSLLLSLPPSLPPSTPPLVLCLCSPSAALQADSLIQAAVTKTSLRVLVNEL